MPNHITNKLTFTTKKYDDVGKEAWEHQADMIRKLSELMLNEDRYFDFNALIPMPEHSDTFFAEGGLGSDERDKYGKNNWYDWSTENWGTKWNAYDVVWSRYSVYFQTAWSMPEPVFDEIAKKFPNEEITILWADEDVGNNCGEIVYKNGLKDSVCSDRADSYYLDSGGRKVTWDEFANELRDERRYEENSLERDIMMEKLKEGGIENPYIWVDKQKYQVFKDLLKVS